MKYSGKIGFVTSKEVRKGIWKPVAVEKLYKGDVLRKSVRWQTADKANDDITITNQISIVANPYAYEHMSEIRYVIWHGAAWKVTGIEDRRPRLILDIGGVYNGDRPDESAGD